MGTYMDTIGTDISRHQGKMDFNKSYNKDIVFSVIRCTVGNYYTDTMFETNLNKLKTLNKIEYAFYHVVTPEYSASSQISRLLRTLDSRLPSWRSKESNKPYIVLDCELVRNQTPLVITNNILECIRLLEAEGFEIIIYTNIGFWDTNVLRLSSWRNYRLWVAHYTSKSSPELPIDWGGRSSTNWTFWQWTDKGKGNLYGSESLSIDLNRYNGTATEFLDMFGSLTDDNDDIENGNNGNDDDDDNGNNDNSSYTIKKAVCLIDRLRIRSLPTTYFSKVIGYLRVGDIPEVLETKEYILGDTWLRIGWNQWSALKYRNKYYMEIIDSVNEDSK